MKNLYHQLLLVIAGATQKQLASQIQYLRAENAILRAKLPHRISLTAQEKNRLVKFAAKLGKAFNELVSIVNPDTLRRWIRQSKTPGGITPAQKGRPRTKQEIRALILQLARGNDWGYTRILGELRKLGIQSVSRNTVKNILKENGLEPAPKRGEGTWDEFLMTHAATLWQCDFYSKKVLTLKGFRDLFLLVFLRVGTRRVFIAPSTFHPNETWMKQQAELFLRHVDESELGATIVMHDRDTKFTASFDQILEDAKLEVKPSAYRSPNTNAFVERFIQTLQQECLDYFVVFGQRHLDHLVAEMVTHYHEGVPIRRKETPRCHRRRRTPSEPNGKTHRPMCTPSPGSNAISGLADYSSTTIVRCRSEGSLGRECYSRELTVQSSNARLGTRSKSTVLRVNSVI